MYPQMSPGRQVTAVSSTSVCSAAVCSEQTFCDLHTCLHLFQLISHIIKPARCNFLLSYRVIYAYFELYPFLYKYVRLSASEMHDFSFRNLHTFYVPP